MLSREWVTNKFIAYQCAAYIKGLTVLRLFYGHVLSVYYQRWWTSQCSPFSHSGPHDSRCVNDKLKVLAAADFVIFRRSQWRKFRQHEDSSISIFPYELFIRIHFGGVLSTHINMLHFVPTKINSLNHFSTCTSQMKSQMFLCCWKDNFQRVYKRHY